MTTDNTTLTREEYVGTDPGISWGTVIRTTLMWMIGACAAISFILWAASSVELPGQHLHHVTVLWLGAISFSVLIGLLNGFTSSSIKRDDYKRRKDNAATYSMEVIRGSLIADVNVKKAQILYNYWLNNDNS